MIRRYLNLCWEHPKGLLAAVAGLTVLLSCLTFGRLGFDANREALFKSTAAERQKQIDFQERFGSWRDLVVVVYGSSVEQREAAVSGLEKLLAQSPLASGVRAKVELPGLDRYSLYFLSVEELRTVDEALAKYEPLLREMSSDGWYGFLEYLQHVRKGSGADSEGRRRFSKVWQEAVEGRGVGALDHLFPRVDLPHRSFFTDGRDKHVIFVHSEDPIALKKVIKQATPTLGFDGRVVLTGQPLLQAEERHDTLRDATLSTVLAILIVQVILVRGFREKARPRLGFLSLVFGLLWSVAWAAVSVGRLNIITINFLAITVGLGVDFSIHILARYTEEKAVEGDSRVAMERTMRTTGLENLVGALATSTAFWALVMTDFRAVQQLGLITGVAVPLCFLSVVTLLPPMLFWWERRSGVEVAPYSGLEFEKDSKLVLLEENLRAHPRLWIAGMATTIALMAYLGLGVRFDYNLLNMQSDRSEAVRFERTGAFNSLAAFVVADNPAEARRLKESLERLPAVSEAQTIAELLPEGVEEKRRLVKSIVGRVHHLRIPTFDPDAKPDWQRMKGLAEGLKGGDPQAEWVSQLKHSGPGPVEDIWHRMQSHLKDELTYVVTRLGHQDVNLDLEKFREQAPDIKRLSSPDGKTVVRVRSKGSLWDRKVLVEFLDQIETVTPDGVGPPFLIRNYLEQLRRSYFDAVRYAVLAIVILLALHFRAVTPTLIALVPKVVGAIGMFAAMAVAQVDLNPANCMALPLTLGIGLVFGIHAVHRCLESPDALLVRGATGKAIALSALTTIASFGTLMVASHPGIFSLGFVMASGVAANMLATFLMVPPLVTLFRHRLKP